jgi:hypothetical protein
MGWDFALGFMPHTDKWRQVVRSIEFVSLVEGPLQSRRMFHQYLRRDAIVAYHPVQLRKIHDLLRGLLSTPEDFVEHTKT